jgi:hypothetical protein
MFMLGDLPVVRLMKQFVDEVSKELVQVGDHLHGPEGVDGVAICCCV